MEINDIVNCHTGHFSSEKCVAEPEELLKKNVLQRTGTVDYA